MAHKLLVIAFAGLTTVAVAQSDTNQAPTAKTATTPAASQPAEQRMHKPMKVTAEVSTAKEVSTGKPSGKMAADDWEAPAAKTAAPVGSHRVAPTMLSDGRTESTSPKTPAQPIQNTSADSGSSKVQNGRDTGTGQASGKQMQKPATAGTDSDTKTTPKVAPKR